MRLLANLRTCVFSATILTLAAGAAVANPLGLYGTGEGQAIGAADSHWTISASTDPALSSGGPAYIVPPATSTATTVPCCWVGSTATSQWLNPTGNAQSDFGAYTYTYTTTFTLPGAPTPYTSIFGSFAGDDNVSIILNGSTVLPGGNGHYFDWTAFDVTSGFQAGSNTLSFLVTNFTGGPSGLQVQLSGQFTPEPASLALVGFALLGAGIVFRRRVNL